MIMNTLITNEGPEWSLNMLRIDVNRIAKDRGLTSPLAVKLLASIASQTVEYDKTRDLLVFEHEMKTGGTSISTVLESLGGVVPGSEPSDYFKKDVFDESLPKNETNASEWWASKTVMYSHNMLNDNKDGNRTKFAKWFLSQVPPTKKVKLLALIRDPVTLIASNYNEWMCAIAERRVKVAKRLGLFNKGNHTIPCMGLQNLTLFAEEWMEYELKPRCMNNETTNKKQERECKSYLETGEDPRPQCKSVQNFLNSSKWYGIVHDLSKRHVLTATNISNDYESIALEKLGGLVHDDNSDALSTLWVGTTERLHESVCLLQYTLGLPYHETPILRHRSCRPTSFWSNEELAVVRKREVISEAINRAANAILDIRMAKMCLSVSSSADDRRKKLYSSCCNPPS